MTVPGLPEDVFSSVDFSKQGVISIKDSPAVGNTAAAFSSTSSQLSFFLEPKSFLRSSIAFSCPFLSLFSPSFASPSGSPMELAFLEPTFSIISTCGYVFKLFFVSCFSTCSTSAVSKALHCWMPEERLDNFLNRCFWLNGMHPQSLETERGDVALFFPETGKEMCSGLDFTRSSKL